jgi:hypothetical protein
MESQDIKVDHRPDGTAKAAFSAYAVAIVGIKRTAITFEVQQDATWSQASSDQAAHSEGLKLAKEKWPSGQGWEHRVAVRKLTVGLDLQKGKQG